jgi:tetratricopeptide (TPR) repeat protein
MNKEENIYSICKNLGITREAVSDYVKKNKNEIENIETIFSLEGADKEKVLALLYLFASGENDKVIRKYRKEAGLKEAIYNSTSGQITQYNLMLIAALFRKDDFFARALTYYRAIKAGFPVAVPAPIPVPVPLQSHASGEMRTTYEYVWIFVYGSNSHIKFPQMTSQQRQLGNAADGTADDFNAMISDYTNKIEANPNDHDARIMRGLARYSLAYYTNGEYKDALEDLQAVSEMNPQGMEGVYYALGNIYYQIGKDEKAIEAFEKVKTINPEFADVNEVLKNLIK